MLETNTFVMVHIFRPSLLVWFEIEQYKLNWLDMLGC